MLPGLRRGSGRRVAPRRITPAGSGAEPAPASFVDVTDGLLPLADHLEGVSRVVVAPHGQWARIPVALLPGLRTASRSSTASRSRWCPAHGGSSPAPRSRREQSDRPGLLSSSVTPTSTSGSPPAPGVRLELRPTPLLWTRAEAQEAARVLGVAPRLG